jgi:hypothetical protein
MLVGYVRVSKADGSQATDLQWDALKAAGVNAKHVYEDTASGKRDDRPGLAACLKALREKDTLVVWKLDRLGRDLRHLVNTVHEPRGNDRHDDTERQAGVRVLRCVGGVRARADRGADAGGDGGGACAWSVGRTALQDDSGEASAGDGGDGQAGDEDRRAMRRVGDRAADAIPACGAGRCDPA